MFSPVAMSGHHVTTAFPQIEEMAGVVVTLYWSRIVRGEEPDFSLIDDTLAYWRARDKRVVLGVATVGHPLAEPDRGKPALATPTPDFVMAQVQTFTQDAPVIGPVRPRRDWGKMATRLPVYWDRIFIAQVERLVQLLSRYDGHPALAQVRISTGILGEDNPTFDGLRSDMPGFSNAAWLGYCRTMTDLYLKWFKHSQLEFDLDRVGWIYARGSPADRQAADDFVRYLRRNRVFLAMNGFDTVNIGAWQEGAANRSGPARCLDYLRQARSAGETVGVEGAPLFNPRFTDTQTIGRAMVTLGAGRLVLFGDAPASLDYARHGLDAQNKATLDMFGLAETARLAAQAQSLIAAIGYTG